MLRRMPLNWLFPLIDRCLMQIVRARLVLKDPWLEILAVQDMHDALRVAGWTEEEFDTELLRHIDQGWDAPPTNGGGMVIPLPIVQPRKVRLAA